MRKIALEMDRLARAEPLADRTADALRDAIIAGDLAPGTHLSVPGIARKLGVSRTPAREALLILEREGLVGRRGSAGMQVLIGDTEQLVALLEMREVLEGLAARRAAIHMDDAGRHVLAALHERHMAVLDDEDLDAHVRLDAEFHGMIRRFAASAILDENLGRIDRIAQVLNRALSSRPGFDRALVDLDHQAIIAAVVAGDGDAAERAARGHIRRMTRFLRSHGGAGRRMAGPVPTGVVDIPAVAVAPQGRKG